MFFIVLPFEFCFFSLRVLFSSTNFYLGGEIDFWGYSGEGVHLHPYISYRMMLSNADLDADDLKINELSFGLRINISK